MDIALYRLHLKSNELVFSEANNSCWIIEKELQNLKELKPEKQPDRLGGVKGKKIKELF